MGGEDGRVNDEARPLHYQGDAVVTRGEGEARLLGVLALVWCLPIHTHTHTHGLLIEPDAVYGYFRAYYTGDEGRGYC